jgi:hypothetical protein
MIIETSLGEVHIAPIIVIKIVLTHGHIIDTKMARWGKKLGFNSLQHNSAICHSVILMLHTCLGSGFFFFFYKLMDHVLLVIMLVSLWCVQWNACCKDISKNLLCFCSKVRESWGTCYQQKRIFFIVTIIEVWKHPTHYSHFVPHVQRIEHVSIRCLLDSSHMNQVEKLHSYFT